MRKCKVKTNEPGSKEMVWVEAEFLGVFQRSVVKQALLIGEVGGTIACPVGVVKLNGELLEFHLEQIRFEED